MPETLFRFNPFNIKEQPDDWIVAQYTAQEESLMFDDSPSALAHDIDVYANMNYLIGEMIARYSLLVSIADAELKVNLSNMTYKQRDQYVATHADKPPAMSYFENVALSLYLKENIELSRMESVLKRYKIAYESIEAKQNALKKKLDAIRFDVLNR